MATEISKSTPDTPLSLRIIVSVAALAICWFVSGVGFGVYLRDIQGSVAFFIWSVPFFAAGWVVMGIPVIALDNRILKIPKILLGIAGAVVGACIMLLTFFIGSVISRGTVDFSGWQWSSLKSWPAFAAAIGAVGATLYAWLFSRAVNRVIRS